jgi:hypothetical protein
VARAIVGGRESPYYNEFSIELVSIETGWSEDVIKRQSYKFIRRMLLLKRAMNEIENRKDGRHK